MLGTKSEDHTAATLWSSPPDHVAARSVSGLLHTMRPGDIMVLRGYPRLPREATAERSRPRSQPRERGRYAVDHPHHYLATFKAYWPSPRARDCRRAHGRGLPCGSAVITQFPSQGLSGCSAVGLGLSG